MNVWRATGLHPRDVERLTLGELGEWARLERRAQARRRARGGR